MQEVCNKQAPNNCKAIVPLDEHCKHIALQPTPWWRGTLDHSVRRDASGVEPKTVQLLLRKILKR